MENKQDKITGDVKVRTPFTKWFENYWYHYKWVTIIVAFVVVSLIIICVQIFSTPKYDSHIMYAGEGSIDNPQDVQTSLAAFMEDYNGDGEKNIAIRELWIVPPEELNDMAGEADAGYLANSAYNNYRTFQDEIMAGETVICFLSPHLFLELVQQEALLSVKDIYPEGSADIFYTYENGKKSDYGVNLSAIDFGTLAGFSNLPDDTVVCIRRMSEMKGILAPLKQDEILANHKKQQELFASILDFEI